MLRFLSLLMAATMLTTPLCAHALDKPKPPARASAQPSPAKAHDRADVLFEEASTAYDARRYAEAEAKLTEAWALRKTHDIAGNLGLVELRLGKHAQAAEHLAWALLHIPPSEADRVRCGYQEEFDNAKAGAATLRVRVNVRGAEVSVNGRAVGEAPLAEEVYAGAGSVTVAAKLAGFVTAQASVMVAKGETREVTLVLREDVPVPAQSGPKMSIVIAGGTTAGAALLVGVVFAALSKAKSNAANARHVEIQGQGGTDACTSGSYVADCSALRAIRRDQDTFADVSLWSFVGAGAAGAGTLVYALVAPKPSRKDGPRIAPLVNASGGGLTVGGTW